MKTFPNAIVVGASSGIGEAIARKLVAEGGRVALVARRKAELDRIAAALGERAVPYVHDVTDFADVPRCFARIVADFGSVDLVIYNSGIMPEVAEQEYDFAKDKAMVDVNLLGAMAWCNEAATYFLGRGSGTIGGISSVAGDRGRRKNPGYHTTKGAFTIYLEALRNRLHEKGVQVVTVKPGPVRTPLTEGKKLPLLIDADECADGALALLRAGSGSGYVPKIWGPIMHVIVHLPSPIFRRMNF